MAGAKSTGPRERQENRRWAEDHLATPSLAQGGQLQDGGLVAGAGGQGKKQDDEQEKQVEEQVEEQVDHSWQVLLLGRDPLILPHPHFHLAGLGLPLTGWQWEEKCAQPLIVSQASAPVQGGQGQGAAHYLLLLIPCFPSQCCCCSLSCQHGLLRSSSQLYKQLHT